MSSGRIEPFGSRRANYFENPPELEDESIPRSAYAEEHKHSDDTDPGTDTDPLALSAPAASPPMLDTLSPLRTSSSSTFLNMSSLALPSPAKSIASDRAVLGSPLSSASSVVSASTVSTPRAEQKLSDASSVSTPRVNTFTEQKSSRISRASTPRANTFTEQKASRDHVKASSLSTSERASSLATHASPKPSLPEQKASSDKKKKKEASALSPADEDSMYVCV